MVNAQSVQMIGIVAVEIISVVMESAKRLLDYLKLNVVVILVMEDATLLEVVEIENSVAEQASSHKWPLSVTMGVATFLKPPASISEMINKADNLMYEAKDAGKHTIKFRTWTT